MRLKRLLFLGHRWLGVMLSLLFVVWFFSGIVMVFVGYPRTDDAQRIAGQPPMADVRCCASSLAEADPGDRLRLRVLDGRLLLGDGSAWRDAGSGEPLRTIDAELAQRIAQAHAGDGATMRRLESIHDDQWTVSGRYHAHRPLLRVAFDGGRWLHVSGSSGEVLLDTTRAERGWNWIGAVSHWLYFTALRRQQSVWYEIIVWLSVAGCLLAVTGMWGGLKQWRWRRRKRGKSPIPYRGAAYWHHAGGLVFGVLIFTFILSGLLSMNPWGLFAFERVDQDDRHALHAGPAPLSPEAVGAAVRRLAQAAPGFDTRELEIFAFDGAWWLQARNGSASWLMPADGGALRERLPASAVEAAADRLVRDRPVRDRQWLHEPDRHYYRSRGTPQLPVLRLRLQDAAETWYYLDPATGRIVRKLDRQRRAYRWWFNALHSLDFPWLIRHRPLWEAVVVAVSIGGLLVSATGLLVGWRRARTALTRVRRRQNSAD